MKRWLSHITAAAFLFIMLLKTASMPLVCIDFAINQNYIARTLCENKAKPAMHCNGKCFMKKQLDRTGENQDAPGARGTIRVTLLDFNDIPSSGTPFCIDMRLQTISISSASPLTAGTTGTLLRPPIS
jgi:hypothetical protein